MVKTLIFGIMIGGRVPLIDKINFNMEQHVEENARVSDFITPSKNWNTYSFVDILPLHIINKIREIPIQISDV